MKSNKFQVALFFVVILATAAPAHANSFNVSASVTTYWDSLRITADPGREHYLVGDLQPNRSDSFLYRALMFGLVGLFEITPTQFIR
jgi:hypothetical protein